MLAFLPMTDWCFEVLILEMLDFLDLPLDEPYIEFFFRKAEVRLVNAAFCFAISFILLFISFCFLSWIFRSSSSCCSFIFLSFAIFFRNTRFGEYGRGISNSAKIAANITQTKIHHINSTSWKPFIERSTKLTEKGANAAHRDYKVWAQIKFRESLRIDQNRQVYTSQPIENRNENQVGEYLKNCWDKPWVGRINPANIGLQKRHPNNRTTEQTYSQSSDGPYSCDFGRLTIL